LVSVWVSATARVTPGTRETLAATSAGSGAADSADLLAAAITWPAVRVAAPASAKRCCTELTSRPVVAASATPSISADAAEATRRGLRMMVARASRPASPLTTVPMRPTSPPSGRTSSGVSTARATAHTIMPMATRTVVPMVRSSGLDPGSPATANTGPKNIHEAPKIASAPSQRGRERPVRSAAEARSASIGATRAARRAARQAANWVTAIPAATGAASEIQPSWVSPALMSKPSAAKSRVSTCDTP
jgi:hypothetical protein